MESAPDRRLRGGIVGGGRGAFIGTVHRIAAELDGQARIVAGAMSSDPQTAAESAAAWHLERSYDDFARMAAEEAARPDGIDFVIVATPNHMHLPVAKAFLEAGIHVVCDKPLAGQLDEARAIEDIVRNGKALFALTHTYAGYPAVQEARSLVADGALGEIRKVLVEYHQDWLAEPLEREGNKQAEWRTDPARAGISCCVADIGSHAQHLLEHVCGLRIVSVCADLTSFVPGRPLDDDASMLLRLGGAAKGVLSCSQVATGEDNHLLLRVYGTKASLAWQQQEPNTLTLRPAGAPPQAWRVGAGYFGAAGKAATRLPAGHPEGYLEAFANLYRAFFEDVWRVRRGEVPTLAYPTVHDGVRGLAFITAAVESSRRGASWVDLAE